MESSLRSAFSLRLRCLRTPAASSMKPRRSSGVACRIESSWPWPTMTCISRPMPESDSSSWTSSSRHERAVDGVLRPAVAEHRPADRDLGVLDRQRAVGVVDGQRDLGAAERRAAGGAGEDDVLHLAAAQRLGALLAHHPGQRVDDVGLAGAVGTDDAGDARLELEGRRGGEGLEPAEGQALQVHGEGSLRSPWHVRTRSGCRAVDGGARRLADALCQARTGEGQQPTPYPRGGTRSGTSRDRSSRLTARCTASSDRSGEHRSPDHPAGGTTTSSSAPPSCARPAITRPPRAETTSCTSPSPSPVRAFGRVPTAPGASAARPARAR